MSVNYLLTQNSLGKSLLLLNIMFHFNILFGLYTVVNFEDLHNIRRTRLPDRMFFSGMTLTQLQEALKQDKEKLHSNVHGIKELRNGDKFLAFSYVTGFNFKDCELVLHKTTREKTVRVRQESTTSTEGLSRKTNTQDFSIEGGLNIKSIFNLDSKFQKTDQAESLTSTRLHNNSEIETDVSLRITNREITTLIYTEESEEDLYLAISKSYDPETIILEHLTTLTVVRGDRLADCKNCRAVTGNCYMSLFSESELISNQTVSGVSESLIGNDITTDSFVVELQDLILGAADVD